MNSDFSYCEVLHREFSDRKQKNARYSLRAFASSLSLSSADLSKILAKKKPLSPAKAVFVAEKLFSDFDSKESFLKSVLNSQTRSLSKQSLDKYLNQRVRFLKDDVVRDLNRWYDYAIPMLTQTAGFRSSPSWIAQRLGISVEQTKESIQKLLRHGILKKNDAVLAFNNDYVTTANKRQTNLSLMLYQKDVLEQSIAKLLQIPVAERSHNTMVLAVDAQKIDLAKKKIQTFIKEMSELLEVDEKTEVYQLQVSLFPLSQTIKDAK